MIWNDVSRKSSLSRLENGKIANPEAKTVQAFAHALDIPPEEIDALRNPAPDFSNIGSLLPWLEQNSRETLEGLVLRFGHDAPETLSLDQLKTYLIEKSKDLKRLEEQIAELNDQSGRIANIKAAALTAIKDKNLDEAKSLISAALTVQRQDRTLIALQEDAELVRVEAGIALFENDQPQAFALLQASTESFRPFDVVEFAQQCILAASILFNHALRYGGDGLGHAATVLRSALATDLQSHDPHLWAKTQNNLALALQNQGSRTGGAAGADLLAEAVTTYRLALEVRTRDAHPVDWAMTQNNLAIALSDQGSRTEGAAGADLLAEAVTACRLALEVRTRDAHPVDWAETQNNLAIALRQQGSRTEGAAGADLLAEAIIAYRLALEVRTRDAHPVQWAETQENLAIAEQAIAQHDTTTDPRAHLHAAMAHVEQALEVYDPDHMPYDFQNATRLRDDLQSQIDAL